MLPESKNVVKGKSSFEDSIGTSLTNFPTGPTAAQRAQMLNASRERVNQQQQNDLAEMIAELHREVLNDPPKMVLRSTDYP